MSGLLQRLGARATGTAWAVRSDARLPFGAERMAGPQMPAADMEPPRPGVGQQPRRQTVDLAPAAAASEGTPPQRQASTRDTKAAPAQPPQAEVPAAQPTTPMRTPTQPQAQSHGPALLLPTATPPVPSEPQPTRTTPHLTAPARAAAKPSTPDAPTPLLPTAPHRNAPFHHSTHAAAAAPTAAQRAQATAPQETEVHIHIGRIDVTALHEAPRPKARPRERAQPMSLDAYLAQRGGGK